jgi:hypothetical protein
MPLDSPLLAFGFANLLMLGWLVAAAAPILIHLWNKRRYREVSWAAVEYLLNAMRKNSRRMRIEQLVLLAVRTAIIVLLVLAVAQPFLEQYGMPFVAGQRTLKILVVDGSYSMGYKPTDKSRFDRAKELATQIVDESNEGDAFTLVLLAAPPSVVVGSPAVDPADFIEEIENLAMTHGGADLAATLAEVEKIVQAAPSQGLARSEVYFLSDLGRNTWAADVSSTVAADFRERLTRLASQAELVVWDLGQPGAENLAVTSLTTDQPFVTLAQEVSVTAQVRNFGTQPRTHQLVELHVDGRRIKESFIDVAPGEQAAVAFRHRFDSPGDHVVEVRLGGDLLDIDNHRWLSVPVKEHLRVLCVNGKPGTGTMNGATDYLALALNPTVGDPQGSGPLVPEVISESTLIERDLSQYDCIFLCNVAQFTSREAKLLEGVLERGGGLVFFLGDQVLADRYNRELGGEQGVRVLPARLGKIIHEPQYQYRFDPLQYRHPLISVFQGREQSGLLSTPVYTYYQLAVDPAGSARIALAFEGGDPAIVEETIHRGRSILVATECSLSSLDAQKNPWTTMPAWPSFVPLVQELVSLAVRGQIGEHNLEVGQTLGQALAALASRPTVTITTPAGAREEVRMTLDPSDSRWSFDDTRQSGVYQAELGTPVGRQELYAVNVNTAESDLAQIAPEELPREFSTHRRTNLDGGDSPAVTHRSGLHKSLLYCVLGLLLAETFLAWRYGRPAR